MPSVSSDYLAGGVKGDSFSLRSWKMGSGLKLQGTVTITPVQGFEPRLR